MSLSRSFLLVILVASLGFVSAPLRAAPASDATAFVKSVVGEAIQALNNKALTDDQREKQFRAMLHSDFDMPRIARFVVGRYWATASEQERQNFQRLFEDYIVRAYSARFSQYSGEQVRVVGSRPESATITLVTSQLDQANGQPAKVDWRVRRQDNDFRIVDIDIEGVSMLLTQREEFASVIQRNGGTIAALNKTLEQRLASGDTSLAAPPLPQRKQ